MSFLFSYITYIYIYIYIHRKKERFAYVLDWSFFSMRLIWGARKRACYFFFFCFYHEAHSLVWCLQAWSSKVGCHHHHHHHHPHWPLFFSLSQHNISHGHLLHINSCNLNTSSLIYLPTLNAQIFSFFKLQNLIHNSPIMNPLLNRNSNHNTLNYQSQLFTSYESQKKKKKKKKCFVFLFDINCFHKQWIWVGFINKIMILYNSRSSLFQIYLCEITPEWRLKRFSGENFLLSQFPSKNLNACYLKKSVILVIADSQGTALRAFKNLFLLSYLKILEQKSSCHINHLVNSSLKEIEPIYESIFPKNKMMDSVSKGLKKKIKRIETVWRVESGGIMSVLTWITHVQVIPRRSKRAGSIGIWMIQQLCVRKNMIKKSNDNLCSKRQDCLEKSMSLFFFPSPQWKKKKKKSGKESLEHSKETSTQMLRMIEKHLYKVSLPCKKSNSFETGGGQRQENLPMKHWKREVYAFNCLFFFYLNFFFFLILDFSMDLNFHIFKLKCGLLCAIGSRSQPKIIGSSGLCLTSDSCNFYSCYLVMG
ncbi:hypothetical protein VP01_738g1 [Puccinia sorghi]|uniref:Uncharacterized protein n=1 Tax=Puccinia sorghi TaxID=27349 RepID=A0A0L6UDH3_9BASI|nr:hypothetical protein VP01_738g1 [Puccinia sorghi]